MNRREVNWEEEYRDAARSVRDLRAATPEILRAFAGLLDPQPPEEEILAAFRSVADLAGHAAACSRPKCRRTGRCMAQVFATAEPSCMMLWSARDVARFEGAGAAMLSNCKRTVTLAASVRKWLDKAFPEDGGPAVKKRKTTREGLKQDRSQGAV